MKSDDIPNVTETTHIGLQQISNFKKSGEINVDNNIKKVQRATYTCSLMSSGFHGHNELDPETVARTLQLTRTYITPILLYVLNLYYRTVLKLLNWKYSRKKY